ncbi:ROK family protein [Kribbella sp. NPDC050241]|uniref:ROK family protein n=1 Tax=Kribbella sp. NPDC050241 TaxID=3364115 RepID=UPI00379B2FD8
MVVTSEHAGFEKHLEKVVPSGPKASEKVSQQVLGAVLQELAIAAPHGCLRSELLNRVGPGDGSTYSAATLSKALAALERAHLISKRAVYTGPSSGGRPPERYTLGSELWAMVGVHISISQNRHHTVTCTIRDLSARLIDTKDLSLTKEPESAQIAQQIGDFVQRMIAKWRHGRAEARILGVGVEVPGHVHRGKVMDAPHSGWEHAAPLAIDLGKALGGELTVVLDNDVNLIALREMYRPDRRTRPQDGAVVAVFDEGVGAGLVVGGRVHRGHSGAAGEPGHNPVFMGAGDPRLPRKASAPKQAGTYPAFRDPCNCGKLHHIDCYAIPDRIAGELGQPLTEFTRLAGEPAYDGNKLTATGKAFWTAGAALGQGIVSLIHAHNPGWLLLLLPAALAEAEPGVAELKDQTAAGLYRQAIETIVNEQAFSSTADDARRGGKYLEVRATAGDPAGGDLKGRGPEKAARNAAVRVLDDFIAHALKQDNCVREQPVEAASVRAVPVGLDERQLAKERQLALTKELREILKYHDPEGLLGAEPLADQYYTEEYELLRLVKDERLDSDSVSELWRRSFSPSKLLVDESKRSEFTRELVTLQARWSSGRIAPVTR